MKTLIDPSLTEAAAALRRPSGHDPGAEAVLQENVGSILTQVRERGDVALRELTARFDGVSIRHLQVSDAEIEAAVAQVDESLRSAIRTARKNIETFHESQREKIFKIETMPGVLCWRESRPIDTVGLYIPGGTAPLISTVLMLGVPAQLAGCKNVIMCSPPDDQGQIHPAILYAARRCGIRDIFRVGGAQAIAAMAFGTESIPAADKIFGPGNQYVTAAKMAVQSMGTAIDMPAGPSEVLVWADDFAHPDFVAADMLAQSEHGADSQSVLICESAAFVDKVKKSIIRQKVTLSRESIVDKSLINTVLMVAERSKALSILNDYAPEHLIIQRKKGNYQLDEIRHAGSVFIGPFTPESAGDYASGTNHTLPTNGYAKMYSGVSLDSFIKKITFQEINAEGLKALDHAISTLADAEQLDAHREAVKIRLRSLSGEDQTMNSD